MSDTKAYHVYFDWGGSFYGDPHEVIFATTNISARKAYANSHFEGDLLGIVCRRLKWADEFAPGPVPIEEMILHGWSYECDHCCEWVTPDNEEPYCEGSYSVFCDQKCRVEYYAQRRREKIIKKYALKAFRENLIGRLCGYEPIVTHEHCFVTRKLKHLKVEQLIIEFNFPGQKYGCASYRMDDREKGAIFMCPNGDRSTFEEWISSLKRKETAA